jgi:hypothetical protein
MARVAYDSNFYAHMILEIKPVGGQYSETNGGYDMH